MHRPARPVAGLLSASVGLLVLSIIGAAPAGAAPAAVANAPVKLAVFPFELEDVSAAGVTATGAPAAEPGRMQAVTAEARRVLAQSGRFTLIDARGVDAAAPQGKSLTNCDGCDAPIALQLGADESLVGLVTRVAKTEYYVAVRLTDARTGKVLDQQSAFFTGADDAWASGTRLLLQHQVLADPN